MPSTNPSLLDVLRRQLDRWNLPFPWGVAYSGGRDSGVLLWALAQLAPQSLVALHVDHGWRPSEEREAEAALVEAWCSRLGVRLQRFPPPVQGLAATEAAARAYRYSCLQTFADANPGSPVFLAHHADDQAETVLMRLLRGRSWRGLAGMPQRRGPFFRPFLELSADVIAETAVQESVPWHEDSTNISAKWTRNHLRLNVFPLLNERFPGAADALRSFARMWALRAPSSGLDGRWTVDQTASVAALVWDSWDVLERQIQLEAACGVLGFSPPSRRFLETVANREHSRAQGGGWSWERTGGKIVWGRVVQGRAKEYFVVAEEGKLYQLETYTLLWSQTPSGSALAVTGIDAHRPLVWRSAVPGMKFSSADDSDWGKTRRRRRLGSMDPSRCALLVQDGRIRAVVDPAAPAVVWSEERPGKLNKTAIFVTLERRSDYER